MKVRLAPVIFAAAMVVAAHGTSYLGSIVSSFNASITLGPTTFFPLGLTYDGKDLWAGYSKYTAQWTLSGSRKNTYYLNDGVNYETAYDVTNNVLYLINKLGLTYTILAVNPGSGSIINSFLVPPPLTHPTGLAFGGYYLYISDYNQDKILKTTTTGSIVEILDTNIFGTQGLTWDGDTAGGPYLFICETTRAHTIYQLEPSSGSTIRSFEGPSFTGNIIGLAWDGTYLWACQNYMGSAMWAFQFVAYDPNPSVAPTSLGKIKALYR